MKLIKEEQLAGFIRDNYKLLCLEAADIDDWDGYDEAFNTETSELAQAYELLLNMPDEEVVKNYETFNKNNE